MITQSRSMLTKHIHHNANNLNNKMNTETATTETQKEIRARPTQQTLPEAPKEIDIYTILQQMSQQSQQSKQMQEQMSQQSQQTQQQIKQLEINITKRMKAELEQNNKQLSDKLATQIIELKRENQETLKQFRIETKTIISEEINSISIEINNRFNDTEKQIKENDDKHSSEIKLINKKLIANSKRCDESFAAHKLEAEKLRELEHKIDNNSGETNLKLQQLQNDVRTKFSLVNASPTNRIVTNEQIRDIKFNGTSDFPMEFIKELTELYQEYYQDINNITWVARHLEGEAAIWWRLIKDSVHTFMGFTEVFVNKYWNDVIQERVGDQLEFGRYHQEAGMNMIQYLERQLLREPTIDSSHIG